MKNLDDVTKDRIAAYIEKSEAQTEKSVRVALTPGKKAELKKASKADQKKIALRLEWDAVLQHTQKMALAYIAQNHSGPWGLYVWEVIRKSEGDESFFRKIAQTIRRAKKCKHRKPMINQNEALLIANWRKVEIGSETLPGLESWAWDAVADFLNAIGKVDLSRAAWIKIAERNGLQKTKIQIASWIEIYKGGGNKSAEFSVTYRGPEKRTKKISAALTTSPGKEAILGLHESSSNTNTGRRLRKHSAASPDNS